MSPYIGLLIIFCVFLEAKSLKYKPFTLRKDLTEHCRRGVPLSVFLGSHVTDSSAQVLQFGKSVVPYSCFIAARTEAGNHIILVMQDMDDEQLQQVCKNDAKQIVVYEIIDTYGGYWGEMPEFIRHPEPLPTNVYTLETTTVTFPTEEETNSTESEEEETETEPPSTYSTVDLNTIAIEIPIVNISGRFISPPETLLDIFGHSTRDKSVGYDSEYLTTMYPLVEFSKEPDNRLYFDMNVNPRYNPRFPESTNRYWDYYKQTTKTSKPHRVTTASSAEEGEEDDSDEHLTSQRYVKKTLKQTTHAKQTIRQAKKTTRRAIKSTKHSTTSETKKHNNAYLTTKHIITSNSKFINIEQLKDTTSKMVFTERNLNAIFPSTQVSTTDDKFTHQDDMYDIQGPEDPPTTFSLNSGMTHHETRIKMTTVKTKSTTLSSTTTKASRSRKPIDLSKLSNINDNHHINKSQSFMNSRILQSGKNMSLRKDNDEFTFDLKNKTDNFGSNKNLTESSSPLPKFIVIDVPDVQTESHVFQIAKSYPLPATSPAPSVSLADRETWENVVLAAPKMARVLNKTGQNPNFALLDLDPSLENVALLEKSKRDKRFLHGITVQNMVPRPITKVINEVSTESDAYNYFIVELEDFAEKVERINEQTQDRVPLRYPNKYVGKELFNLCDHKDLQTRHMFMFNSSRIWIKITNFSLETVSLVLTEAKRVDGTDTTCDSDYLECQLTGTRVCIDALNACDGVPNCGAYDIYDEDRLRCGYATGMQQSVYVAALAFLILANTMIYIIMYWLKRCVPKVSKAFFIYSEGAENVLNLRTIMRSPYFNESFDDDIFEDDNNFEHIMPSEEQEKNKFSSILQMLCGFIKYLCKKRNKMSDFEDKRESRLNKKESYVRPGLFMMSRYFEDVGVQTSIEMHDLVKYDDIEENEAEELKLIKFFRDSKDAEIRKEIKFLNEHDEFKKGLLQKSKYDSRRIHSGTKTESHKESASYSGKSDPYPKRRRDSIYVGSLEDLNPEESVESVTVTTTADIHPDSSLLLEKFDKKLRFREFAITIKNSEDVKDSTRFSTEKLDQNDSSLDKIEVLEDSGTGKQSKMFWLGKKKKKPVSVTTYPRARPS